MKSIKAALADERRLNELLTNSITANEKAHRRRIHSLERHMDGLADRIETLERDHEHSKEFTRTILLNKSLMKCQERKKTEEQHEEEETEEQHEEEETEEQEEPFVCDSCGDDTSSRCGCDHCHEDDNLCVPCCKVLTALALNEQEKMLEERRKMVEQRKKQKEEEEQRKKQEEHLNSFDKEELKALIKKLTQEAKEREQRIQELEAGQPKGKFGSAEPPFGVKKRPSPSMDEEKPRQVKKKTNDDTRCEYIFVAGKACGTRCDRKKTGDKSVCSLHIKYKNKNNPEFGN